MSIQSIKDFINKMNLAGVPMPVMRDPKTSLGSITATLVVLSSILMIVSLISSKVDKSGAVEFYVISLGAYLGRKFQTKGASIEDTKVP
jgi:hypothetical protein